MQDEEVTVGWEWEKISHDKTVSLSPSTGNKLNHYSEDQYNDVEHQHQLRTNSSLETWDCVPIKVELCEENSEYSLHSFSQSIGSRTFRTVQPTNSHPIQTDRLASPTEERESTHTHLDRPRPRSIELEIEIEIEMK